ncbi:hypothetical protein MRX96_035438 [Rhipicephalus microplus]
MEPWKGRNPQLMLLRLILAQRDKPPAQMRKKTMLHRSRRPPWSRPGPGVIRALGSRPALVSRRMRSPGPAQIQRTGLP